MWHVYSFVSNKHQRILFAVFKRALHFLPLTYAIPTKSMLISTLGYAIAFSFTEFFYKKAQCFSTGLKFESFDQIKTQKELNSFFQFVLHSFVHFYYSCCKSKWKLSNDCLILLYFVFLLFILLSFTLFNLLQAVVSQWVLIKTLYTKKLHKFVFIHHFFEIPN